MKKTQLAFTFLMATITLFYAACAGNGTLEPGTAICPAGTTALENGKCQINDFICPAGAELNSSGKCVVSKAACPAGTKEDGSGNCLAPKICPPGTVESYVMDGASEILSHCVILARDCPPGSKLNDNGQCIISEKLCPAGSNFDGTSGCVIAETSCPTGSLANEDDECIVTSRICYDGSSLNALGQCVINTSECSEGVKNGEGKCIITNVSCPDGSVSDGNGYCIISATECPEASVKDGSSEGRCIISQAVCPPGTNIDSNSDCVIAETSCPDGSSENELGECLILSRVCSDGSSLNSQGQCIINERLCPEGSSKNENGECVIAATICPEGSSKNNSGECVIAATICPEGSSKNNSGECVIAATICPEGSSKNNNGECVIAATICPEGSTFIGSDCVVNSTSCPSGSTFNNLGQCIINETDCPEGSLKTADNKCLITTKICPEHSTMSADGLCVIKATICPTGSEKNGNGECVINSTICPEGSAKDASGVCVISASECPVGTSKNGEGRCVILATICPSGSTGNSSGQCIIDATICPEGTSKNEAGKCVIAATECPSGTSMIGQNCVVTSTICPVNSDKNELGQCVVDRTVCPAGSSEINGQCVINATVCPAGSTLIAGDCVLDDVVCPQGKVLKYGVCVEEKLANGTQCNSASECESGYCVDGVCCNNSCPTPDSCVNGTHISYSCATNPGVCEMSAISCGNYICEPGANTCKDVCADDLNCQNGAFCISGECVNTCLKGSGFYGRDCHACPDCGHGTCDDGRSGSGKCICEEGFSGQNCNNQFPMCTKKYNVYDQVSASDCYFVDTRATPRSYPVVAIGNQIWLAENMRYDGVDYHPAPYGGDSGFASYLYSWADAQNVCPDGWHMPSRQEYGILISYVKSNSNDGNTAFYLTAQCSDWDYWYDTYPYYTNYFGFSAYPTGGGLPAQNCLDNNHYDYSQCWRKDDGSVIWSSTNAGEDSYGKYAYTLSIYRPDDTPNTWASYVLDKYDEYAVFYWPVRCLMDYSCGDHGEFDNQRGCVCATGWSGERCEKCASGFSGPNCEWQHGYVQDERDGNKYRTVMIGEQKWLAENMRYAEVTHYSVGGDSANDATYGYLYTALNAQNVCPVGWHLPTKSEFNTLNTYVTAHKTSSSNFLALIANSADWSAYALQGGDDFAFGALPSSNNSQDFGTNAYFWSNTPRSEANQSYQYYFYLSNGSSTSYTSANGNFAVRCVENYSCPTHARWDNRFGCICTTGWTGERCETCAVGYSGEDCTWSGGYVEDSRDGESYRTITIGTQTWLAENMRYTGVTHYSAGGESSNDAIYGYLYSWDDAQNVCPSGWHLPTQNEFNTLYTYANTHKSSSSTFLALIAKNGDWLEYMYEGGDDFGFSALPAGNYYSDNYNYLGISTFFWSSTEYDSSNAYYLYYVANNNANVSNTNKTRGYSVRCVKN